VVYTRNAIAQYCRPKKQRVIPKSSFEALSKNSEVPGRTKLSSSVLTVFGKDDWGQHSRCLASRALRGVTFLPKLLNIGNELIVYASRIPSGNRNEYFPLHCNTGLAKNAADIRKLGSGKTPRKNSLP